MRANALSSDRRRGFWSTARRQATAATVCLTVVAAGLALGRTAVAQWSVVGRPGATPDEALALVAAGVALALILWLALSTAAVLLSHVPGQCGLVAARVADAWAPSVSRRLAGALLGVAAVGAVAPGVARAASPTVLTSVADTLTPAADTAGGVPGGVVKGDGPVNGDGPGFGSTAPLASGEAPAPGWLPSRPVARADARPVLLTSVPRPEPDRVVVRRGDTLWDLARRDLGPDATDAEVAQSWPRWHTANRRVIGPDPGRLRPGQILRRPGPDVVRGYSGPTTGAHR